MSRHVLYRDFGGWPVWICIRFITVCSLWFLCVFPVVFSFDLCFPFPPAPSSFVVRIIRIEIQSRVCVAVWRGPGGEQHYFHFTSSLSK